MVEIAAPPLTELRRFEARPDAEIAAWALRAAGIAAELRRVGRSDRLDEVGRSVLLIPGADLDRALEVLSADRFRVSDAECYSAATRDVHWFAVTPQEIESGLAEIRRRDRSARFWLWTLFPVVALAALSGKQWVLSAVGLFWCGAIVRSQWRAGNADCPRCGLPFAGAYVSDHWRVAFTRRCVACGLSKDGAEGAAAG